MSDIEECFKKQQLVKTKSSNSEVMNCLELAEAYLEKAKKIFGHGIYDIAFLTVYTSMFHSARALLFSKGLKERSHYCMLAYLKREFSSNDALRNLLNILDNYRQVRNTAQYEGLKIPSEEAKNALIDAEDFIGEVEKYLKGAKPDGKN